MLRASPGSIDESAMTKGQLRKLNALRKSVGPDIGDRAFAEWLSRQAAVKASDRNAEVIVESPWPLVQEGKLKIRPSARAGNLVSRRKRDRRKFELGLWINGRISER